MEDPSTFTAPFSGELPFNRIDEQLFEYACHEGNYAMTNILSGERMKEKQTEPKKQQRVALSVHVDVVDEARRQSPASLAYARYASNGANTLCWPRRRRSFRRRSCCCSSRLTKKTSSTG